MNASCPRTRKVKTRRSTTPTSPRRPAALITRVVSQPLFGRLRSKGRYVFVWTACAFPKFDLSSDAATTTEDDADHTQHLNVPCRSDVSRAGLAVLA
jgi:hypothetical protein